MRFSDGEFYFDEFEREPLKFSLRRAVWTWIAPVVLFVLATRAPSFIGLSLVTLSMIWLVFALTLSFDARSQRPPKESYHDDRLAELLGRGVKVYPSRVANMLLINDEVFVSSAGVHNFSDGELRVGAEWLGQSLSVSERVKVYVVALSSLVVAYGVIPTAVGNLAKDFGYPYRPIEFVCQLVGFLILLFVADTHWCNSIFKRDAQHSSQELLSALRKAKPNNLTKERIKRLESLLGRTQVPTVEAILSE